MGFLGREVQKPSTPRTAAHWSRAPVAQSQARKASKTTPISCPEVLLNDDLVYLILTVTLSTTKTDRERREDLFRYSLVCQVWGRAAQSLLFRHVFIQIRPPMLSLLEIITHSTERGRRLAGYIKSAEIRLSRESEPNDPPSLPMIHPRHLPALLCHMPNLRELDLTTGGETLSNQILQALASGPQIRIITLRDKATSVSHPVLNILPNDVNPWPHLESITIKHPDRFTVGNYSKDADAPKITLSQLSVEYLTTGGFEEVPWLTRYSKDTLTHFTLMNGVYDTIFECLSSPSLKNIRSLSFGRITWTDDFLRTLHNFNRLQELRFLSSIRLMRDFPSNLPDTIQHLVLTNVFSRPMGLLPVPVLDDSRPALLDTCVAIMHFNDSWIYRGDRMAQMDGDLWVAKYTKACRNNRIHVEISVVSEDTYYPTESRVHTTRLGKAIEPFEPTPPQLDCQDFDIIKGRYKGEIRYVRPPHQTSSATNGQSRHPSSSTIRGLKSWWQIW